MFQKERDLQIRSRLHALWLLRQGISVQDVAAFLGVHPGSVYKWLAWYRAGGLTTIYERKIIGGSASWLNDEQKEQLIQQAQHGTFQNAKEVQEWLEHTFGVTYRLKGVYRLLSRLNIKLNKTYRTPPRLAS